jgi:sodium transport system permease protein
MRPANVQLILAREIRDQLRDRRTLFMIFVLPILLYPLLGVSYVQVKQFMQERPTSVLVLGASNLPADPPLVVDGRFAEDLFSAPGDADLLALRFDGVGANGIAASPPPRLREEIARGVREGRYDAAVFFPRGFGRSLEALRQAIREGGTSRIAVPRPEIIYTTADEKSEIAFVRVSRVLDRWTQKVGERNLAATGVPLTATTPFDVGTDDVSGQTVYQNAAVWSKILPVILLIWALTGAFYPAVDLCAGEKERGTLETLLSSPAARSEIVLGKLVTVMLFSMATAILNLVGIGATGWLLFAGIDQIRMPPATSIAWLLLALVPVSALFSALSLALAAFARSTKEGQYYLMPLLLVTMPLVLLPMSPGVELNLGNSLIPLTGMVLLLRHLIEGDYAAIQYLPAVLGVTLAACALAIRWAVDQFNSESVLFHEGEQWELGAWLRHLVRDRRPTPTAAIALCAGIAILAVNFWAGSAIQPRDPQRFGELARSIVLTQLAVILAPVLLLTPLVRSPRDTFLLRRPPWAAIPAAIVLAAALHPLAVAVQAGLQALYPIGETLRQQLLGLESLLAEAPLWQLLLVMALLPAVCEELAFRGFLLSGFLETGRKWQAIALSAVFFAMVHGILQQSLMACLLGIVIGYVALQSRSIFPAILFHLVHNSLGLTAARLVRGFTADGPTAEWPLLDRLVRSTSDGGYMYHWPVIAVGVVAAAILLAWFRRLDHPLPKGAQPDMIRAIP